MFSILLLFFLFDCVHPLGVHRRARRDISLSFEDHPESFTFAKDEQLLTENNGEVVYDINAHLGGSNDPTGSIKVELEIEKEEPGKLYTDLSFDTPDGRHYFEVFGGKGGKHRFLVNDYHLIFKYNKNAPKFKVTFRQVFLPSDCTCFDSISNFNRKDVPEPEKYPQVVFSAILGKRCSSLACSWSFDDVDKSEDVKFSFSGTIDPADKFYVKSFNGSTSFEPEGFQRFALPGREPFVIYFLAAQAPKMKRNGNFEVEYKADLGQPLAAAADE